MWQMNSNWDILGIDATTDKRVIKRAYAKMLAKYHPEEFPEKYEEINRAYQWALTYHDGEVDSAFPFIESYHEPDMFLEATYEITDTAEPYFIFENDINSIFVSGTDFEAVTEEDKQAEKALGQFRNVTDAPVGTLWHDVKGAWVLKIFMDSETSKAARRNPAFIDGLVKLLPYIYFSNFHVFVLRRALGIQRNWDAGRDSSDIVAALTRLDTMLEARTQYNFARLRRFIIALAMCIAIIVVVWLALVFIASLIERPAIGRIASTHQSYPRQVPRQANIHLYQTQAYFEEFIRPNPSAFERWYDSLKNHLTDWLYKTAERRVVVGTVFLNDNIEVPHMVSFIFWDETSFRVLFLSMYFAEDAEYCIK